MRVVYGGLGFRVWGLGFGVWGLGFGVWGLGFGVWGLGFRAYLEVCEIRGTFLGSQLEGDPTIWGLY